MQAPSEIACPRSPGGKRCEPTVCSACGLERRRQRFVAGPEAGDELPVERPTTEWRVPGTDEWVELAHVPPCKPAFAASVAVPPRGRMGDPLDDEMDLSPPPPAVAKAAARPSAQTDWQVALAVADPTYRRR